LTEAIATALIELAEKAATRLRRGPARSDHCPHRRPAGSEVTGALRPLEWEEHGAKLRDEIATIGAGGLSTGGIGIGRGGSSIG
jgi:hypothetical protein